MERELCIVLRVKEDSEKRHVQLTISKPRGMDMATVIGYLELGKWDLIHDGTIEVEEHEGLVEIREAC